MEVRFFQEFGWGRIEIGCKTVGWLILANSGLLWLILAYFAAQDAESASLRAGSKRRPR